MTLAELLHLALIRPEETQERVRAKKPPTGKNKPIVLPPPPKKRRTSQPSPQVAQTPRRRHKKPINYA